jgi:hypothetical protein
MKLVRLFVLHNNRRFFVDIPYGEHTEKQAELELAGADVYHAALLSTPPKTRKYRTGARLKQRMY